MAEDFPTLLKRLAAERGVSVNRVGFEAYDPNITGTNPDTLKSVMAGRRRVTATLIEAVADVLDVEPQLFAEYRLAMMRQSLDERDPPDGVGLEEALAQLSRIEEALGA